MSNNILKLENNVNTIYNLISFIQKEFKQTIQLSNKNTLIRLMQENVQLENQIKEAKDKLIKLQGNSNLLKSIGNSQDNGGVGTVIEPTSALSTETSNDDVKPKKEKSKKSSSKPKAKESEDEIIDASLLHLRVGKILEASKHPEADTLYVEKVDVGEATPRTVVSGLVNFVPLDQMQNRMVVLLCNLKPAKMRGITSEAMVMCASTPEKVEILSPPPGSLPGEPISIEGYTENPNASLTPKKKHVFETIALDLKTNDQKVATYKNIPWCVGNKGVVTCDSLTNVHIK